MTVNLNSEQLTEFEPESERRKRTDLLVLHNAFKALWESEVGKRTNELSVLDGVQVFLGLVRHILFNCEHLVLQGRNWNFKWRQGANSAPLGGLVTSILTLQGVPLRPEDIANLLAPWRHQHRDVLEEMVTSFLLSRLGHLCFETEDGRFGLLEWIPQVEGFSVEDAIEQEFWQREGFANWLLSITPSGNDPRENAIALLDSAEMPLSHRELLFALWAKSSGNLEILPTFVQLLDAEGLQTLALGYWITEKGKAALTNLLLQQSEEWQQKAQQRARFIETRKLQQLLSSLTELTTDLSSEVGDEIAEWLETQDYPVPLTRIAEQVLEVLPTDPDYEQTLCSLFALLVKDGRFIDLGGQCWWRKDKTPEHVLEIPSLLVPPPPPTLTGDLTGQVDLVLPIEGIDDDLRRFVEDPSYEEVGETDVVLPSEFKPPKRVDTAVIYPHLQVGTLKIRRIDIPFFQPEPPLKFFLAVDDKQEEVGLWVNLSLGLCFGLSDWYRKRKVEVGGIVRLERTKTGILRLIWTNRYDRWLHIPRSRLEELLQFAAHETIRQAPLITLVQSLLTQHPQGIHFLRLWSELNVLRRTTKIALASILCAYPMFTRVQGQEGYWTLDFTKFTEGIRPEKRAFLEMARKNE
ncbi:MAG: hypothetical protein N3B10_04070 [Armatimonadetes bacterium]|nr:hypothetical protein [Armatimonadota bacterium]MCX7967653.1 hypothetical protein [Armatimonadota bacterium]MDW8144103.1 hypothetical protein [Armatimonadota bacterium]